MTSAHLTRLLTLALLCGASSLAGCITERVPVYPTHPEGGSAAAPVAPPAPAPPPVGAVTDQVGRFARFSTLFGWRGYDSSFDPVDDQFVFQLGGTHETPRFPVGIEWAIAFASDSQDFNGFRFTNQNFELSLGPTKTFHLGGGRWFTNVGAGVAWTYTEEGETNYCCSFDGEDDNWFGAYAHAALIYRVSPSWDIVLDVRGLTGEDIELGPFTLEGEYLQLALGFGFGI